MSPEQLDIIIAGSKEDFPVIVGELHQHILDAAAAVLEETQDSEKKPKVTVAVSLILDLSIAPLSWQLEAAVGVRRKVRGETHFQEREETPELPGIRNN